MTSSKSIQLCNLHYKPIWEHLHPFKKSSHGHLQSMPPPTQATTNLISRGKKKPLLKFQMHGIIWHVGLLAYCFWGSFSCNMYPWFAPFFVEQDSIRWIYHSVYVYSPSDGHVHCFQVLAVMNNTLNMGSTCVLLEVHRNTVTRPKQTAGWTKDSGTEVCNKQPHPLPF